MNLIDMYNFLKDAYTFNYKKVDIITHTIKKTYEIVYTFSFEDNYFVILSDENKIITHLNVKDIVSVNLHSDNTLPPPSTQNTSPRINKYPMRNRNKV